MIEDCEPSTTRRLSLSARRAWIEILGSRLYDMSAAWSLSARRAWIEILLNNSASGWVALRKESVDRNQTLTGNVAVQIRRSPQGERG